MTHAHEAITNFIEYTIEDMEHTIKFTAKKEWGNQKLTKREYARWSIERSEERAAGALLYAKIYAKEITEEQYEELRVRLHDAYRRIEEKTWEL